MSEMPGARYSRELSRRRGHSAGAFLPKRVCFIPAILIVSHVTFILGCRDRLPSEGTPIYTYNVVNVYPHDAGAFTQGLVYDNGVLYEGTGLLGRSTLRKVDLQTGKVLQSVNLSENIFGEGITVVGERIIQLTLESNIALIYDKQTLQELKKIPYPRKGWGLAFDGKNIIASDGSPTLYFLDTETLETVRTVQVSDANRPAGGLNELEYVEGKIYANVWQTDRIAIISPETGEVSGWVDLSGLLGDYAHGARVDVLNGIAYDPAGKRLLVTGKLWPKLFHIKSVQRN